MNKLVSRNPVQRFKQGRKIIKAQGGLDNTFKLLSDTAKRTAEREQYWANEEARKARAAYDRQMKSSKKSKKKAGRLQTYKGQPIVEIDGLGRGAIENADGSYTWVDVKDFDGQNIQDTMPFESTVKNYPIDLTQIPEVSGITFASQPKVQQTTPVIDVNKIPYSGKAYSKSDVRDYMRRHGVNAYSYTADYRKALRKVLNGQGSQDDYNMVRAMGLKLKKGGLLPSRNSIQRFKNRKFN